MMARRTGVALLTLTLAACGAGDNGGTGGGAGTGSQGGPTHHVLGTVTGLAGTGLALQLSGADTLSIAAGATSFRFTGTVAEGSAYHVAVTAQPTAPAQVCTVTGGDGTMASTDVTGVSVTCLTQGGAITVSGTVTGLAGTGLTLRRDASTALTLPAGAASFTFPGELAQGASYAVTVDQGPSQPWQTCTVTNGAGTATVPVTNVVVACTTNLYAVRGTVSGLVGSGLALTLNGGTPVAVPAGGSTFAFPPIPSMTSYTLSVAAQPTSPPQVCTVATAGGSNVAAPGATSQVTFTDIGNALVTCAGIGPAVGGWVTGLTRAGLALELNGSERVTVPPGATSFRFATGVASGDRYGVTIVGQPAGQPCVVQYAKGVKGDLEVASVAVRCESAAADPLSGVFAKVNGSGVRSFIAFWPDGTFTYASRDDDPGCPSRGNGVEYGFYTYSAATGAFRFQDAPTDSNGYCGFLHGGGANLGGTLLRVGGDIEITAASTGRTQVFSPVPSTPGTITGAFSWAYGPSAGSDGCFAVFLADGTYVVVNAQQGLTGGVRVGYERACYQATASAITANFGSTCTPDGAPVVMTSDGAFPSGQAVPYTVTGPGTILLDGAFTLTRIPTG